MIYDYPIDQACLAKCDHTVIPPIAERFELYLQGIELGNGFHELNDATEQQRRFEQEQQQRQLHNQPCITIDPKFISCLDHLPDCAGVAIGLDRLFMILSECDHIHDTISFGWEHL